MADKEKAGPSTGSDSLIDFAALPPSALDSYITYYDLAKGYPPPPSKRSPSPDEDEEMNGDQAGEGRPNSRRGSRVSAKTDDPAKSSRLRPRSPSSSVAHLFPGNARRLAASGATGEENGLAGPAATDGKETDASDDPCPSHFFDVQEADDYLAATASKHFAAQPQPKEGEVVVQFLYRCKAGDKSLKVAS